jgi:hypothetical protein
VNQDRLKQLKSTIEKQVDKISAMAKELDKYTIPKNTPQAQIVNPPSEREVPDTNDEGMEEEEITNMHDNKIAGHSREGPQNGARPKELKNKDVQPKHKFDCTECPEKRASKDGMAAHMSCHREPGMHKCDDCSYKSNERIDLRNHRKQTRHTGTFKEYVCHECRLEFYSEEEEKNHMETHVPDGAGGAQTDQREAKFKCPICGFTAKTESKIEKHMSCHDGNEEDSTFLCGDCSFQSMNRDQLLEHLETKHDKHICYMCNIASKSKNELNKHIAQSHKSHKPCRDFATNSCHYKSECKYKHIILQRNEQICYTCGTRTNTMKDLMAHIKEVHGSQSCTKSATGQCDRGRRCWYSHSKHTSNNRNQSTPTKRQGGVQEDEEEDFQESPRRPRRPYSQVAGAGNNQQEEVHKVSENTQHQNLIEATRAALSQLMPTIVQKILESIQQTN